jgi:high-affinity iron transporter
MISRFLSSDSDDSTQDTLFNVAIATIFAREVLEGAIIIGQYRTVIQKSLQWDDEFKAKALKTVTYSALFATAVAVLVVVAVGIPLGILSQDLDEHTVAIIEGLSKVVAAICILQLSLKMPYWLGLYEKVSLLPKESIRTWCSGSYVERTEEKDVGLTLREIRFNVAWNVWREVAECGVFLIPFFLGTGAKAIPLSALVGIAVSLVLGLGIYFANTRMNSKFWLAFVMSGLTLMLSVGLFVGGCHEFEEVWGETREVWSIENPNMSSSQLPMVLLKPFGYSSSRTVLQICTFWCWLALGLLCHGIKDQKTKGIRSRRAQKEAADKDNIFDPEKDAQVDDPNCLKTTAHTGTEVPSANSDASSDNEAVADGKYHYSAGNAVNTSEELEEHVA